MILLDRRFRAAPVSKRSDDAVTHLDALAQDVLETNVGIVGATNARRVKRAACESLEPHEAVLGSVRLLACYNSVQVFD